MEQINYTNQRMSKKINSILQEKKIKVLVSTNFAQSKLSHELTKIQWNLFFYSIYKLNNSISNIVQFNILDFCIENHLEELKDNYYNFAKNQFKYIKGLSISTSNPKFNQWRETNIFSDIQYDNSILTIEFNPKLLPEFQQLTKNYTYQDLQTFISFEKKYSKKMYIYFRSLYNPNKEVIRDFNLNELRELLNIPSDKYLIISNFKIKIINVFIKDINKFNKEFKLSVKDIKNQRKRTIEGFSFTMKTKLSKEQLANKKELGLKIKEDKQKIDFELKNKKTTESKTTKESQQLNNDVDSKDWEV